MSTKKLRSYRLSEEAYQAIKRMAGEDGMSEAAVIESWALTERGAEKNWVAPREGWDDIPDEMVVKKPVKVLPKVVKGSEIKQPVDVRKEWENLALSRGLREPLGKRNGKLL